jgi:D-glycero-D-manno-heptose 1,7-bisphosphate phosphatase
MRKCVFFDRDGIVNESPGPGYVTRWEDFRLLSPFVDALRVARGAGYEAVVVTNQRGVALDRVSRETLDEIHARLRRRLEQEGLALLDVLYCPHDDVDGCDCRKPKPGMLVEAARRHGLDLSQSWMVGDGERDIAAGRAARCRTIRVCPPDATTAADIRIDSMEALAAALRRVL